MKKLINCRYCGDLAEKKYNGFCQSCYIYFVRDNKKVYEKPAYGEIAYNENGDCICPECGLAYKKLGSHLWNKHHLSAREGYKRFGWDMNVKASNVTYREHMKKVQQPKCISINLMENGKNTRFVNGCKGRTKDMVSEMTRRKLANRFRNKKEVENDK